MEIDLVCIKIKDGLYIGNKTSAEDLEFMLTNKFAYVLNCTAEIPNYFESMGTIKYYKLKYQRNKQKLWGETFKKLHKIIKFIEESQENAQCCLIHSNHGDNRSIAVVIAYLMKKFFWTFDKTLLYLKSKKIQMKLSSQFVNQLKNLQEVMKIEHPLTSDFKSAVQNQEELILSNTYKNTIEIKYVQNNKEKGEKHIQWKDKLEKELANKKERIGNKQGKNNNSKVQKQQNIKLEQKPKKKKNEVLPKSLAILEKNHIQNKKIKQKQKAIQESLARVMSNKFKQPTNQSLQDEPSQKNDTKVPIYNLTVNNYINPNIQIYSQEKSNKNIRPVSSGGDRKNIKKLKQENLVIETNFDDQMKINRTFSQKQHRTALLKEKSKTNANPNSSLMKSLMGFQQDIKKTLEKKSQSMNKYRSTNLQYEKMKLESPKTNVQGKKLEKSMSFQSKLKK